MRNLGRETFGAISEFIIKIAAKNKITASIINESTLPQVIKYLLVGFSSALFEVFLFVLLRDKTHFTKDLAYSIINSPTINRFNFNDVIKIQLYASNTIAYTIIFIYNFILQRSFTFRSDSKILKQIFMYGLLFGFNLIVSNLVVDFLILDLQLGSAIAKIIAIALVVSWNFVIYQKIIFRKTSEMK